MLDLGELLREAQREITENMDTIEKRITTLNNAFDLYFENKFSKCTDEECKECIEEHGTCVIESSAKNCFMAGASAFFLILKRAQRSEEKGAITKAMEDMDGELTEFGKKQMMMKLASVFGDRSIN